MQDLQAKKISTSKKQLNIIKRMDEILVRQNSVMRDQEIISQCIQSVKLDLKHLGN